ncbi:VOC family protein [Priestia aryabhattai]|uniref:VOC family protein n=1 Tax=Priestia aryabhattai TaxID=412384 RepID=UPI0008DD08EA|nr:VOC family protein [Priestia aryabhattai]MBZ6489408.1 VOC family protein [Priestia aryabhattai]MDH3111640.1 VOC family protein [Priestia aryabhattai]MDH3129444.1 VOC family protein [Priestia aryabhattai]MDH3130354.1 VOC family protein [Priestia aryabhattai]MED4156281.1 VOC family protein [Priestia aryabhattai]
MVAITHVGLAVPNVEEAVHWYEQVLGFKRIAGPYMFNAEEEKAENMTQDLLGSHIKKMKNVHMTADNQVGIELFEFNKPQMPLVLKDNDERYQSYFHMCLIVDDVKKLADKIEQSGGKKRSQVWNTRPGKPYYLIYCEDPFGNIIELYSHSTELMYGNREE